MPNINLLLVFTDKHDEVGFNRNTVEMCTCVFQMKSLALIWRCLILWRGRGGGVERERNRGRESGRSLWRDVAIGPVPFFSRVSTPLSLPL